MQVRLKNANQKEVLSLPIFVRLAGGFFNKGIHATMIRKAIADLCTEVCEYLSATTTRFSCLHKLYILQWLGVPIKYPEYEMYRPLSHNQKRYKLVASCQVLPACQQVETNLSISSSCKKYLKIRLVATCHLQTCYNHWSSQPDDLVPLCKIFVFIDCEINQFLKKWIMMI